MDCRGMMRKQLLEKIYSRMSDEETRTFVQLTLQDKDHREIMSALNELRQKADNNHHSWISDFGANIAGNAVFDGAVWLLSKFIKRL